MASLSVPSFSNGTTADANAVTGNFNNVKTFVENQLVQIDGSVKAPTVAIADLAITTGKIADSAVTAAKIADGTVGTAELANDSVTADKVLDGSTLPVNITGNAATATSAGTATNASSASYAVDAGTANSLEDAGATIYWNGIHWTSSQQHYFNGGLNVSAGNAIFNGTMYAASLGPSSSTTVIVAAGSELKRRELNPWSLRELKERIEPLENALSKIKALQPRTFVFKEEALVKDEPYDAFNRREQLQYGFIVDEVASSETPDLVSYGSNDGVSKYQQTWKIDGTVSIAVAAIKELLEKVEALEARIVELESK